MTKSKLFTGIKPERSEAGQGWIECEPHRAHAFAVYYKGERIGRYGPKRLAEQTLDQVKKAKAPPKRAYKLGKRMEPRS